MTGAATLVVDTSGDEAETRRKVDTALRAAIARLPEPG